MFQGTIAAHGRTAVWRFTDRRGGVSIANFASRNLAAHVGDDPRHVRANREGLADAVGAGSISWMGPVHGTDIEVLETPRAISPNVDALATTAARVPVATLGADCVPLLMVAGDWVIAAHIGWRGLAEGMSQRLRSFCEHAGTVQVLLGPAICGACYDVCAERAAMVESVCAAAVVTATGGGPGIDIRRGLASDFRSWGARVQAVGGCTAEDSLLFSHRRDGVTGRQAGVIAWMN